MITQLYVIEGCDPTHADCDRKYLLSCSRLQSVIFEASENLRQKRGGASV